MKFTGTAMRAFFVIALTIGAVTFAAVNMREQLRKPPIPDDGVVWVEGSKGVEALDVRAGSPAFNAGIRPGQYLRYVYNDGAWEEIHSVDDVGYYLDHAGLGGSLVYQVERISPTGESLGLWEGDVKSIEPLPSARGKDLYFALIAVVYLAIGLFVFLRQGRAPYSFHFFWICLTAFLFYILKPTLAVDADGRWDTFDQAVLLVDNIAFLLAAPLFVHFCTVFPSKPEWLSRRNYRTALLYVPAAVFVAGEIALLAGQHLYPEMLTTGRNLLDWFGVFQFAVSIVAADLLLINSYVRASTPALKLQLKWIMWGVGLAAVPYALFYAAPRLLGRPVTPIDSVLALGPLILVPLSFGYSIVRYRMMDVDVIVRRSFVHVLVTAAAGALYLTLLLTVGDTVKEINPDASTWVARAVTVAVMLLVTILFAPIKTWLQQTSDRLFYGERYTLRKGLGEFGRALASTSDLDTLLTSLAARLRRMLSVDQLAIFVEDARSLEQYRLMLSTGLAGDVKPPPDFQRWTRANSAVRGYALAEEAPEGDWAGIHYVVPCVVRDRMVAMIGVGRQTNDGSLVTSEDIEILRAISGYVAVAIDNSLLLGSEREKAELLAHLKQFSESIIESVNVGILVIDSSGRITTWNSALEEMLGIPREVALNCEAPTIFNAEMLETLRAVTGTSGWVVDDVRHLYKFRTLTLRQLRDSGGQMMHSALFTSTREVVNYFNAGIPQDALAVAAGNVTPLFTHPRGPGSEPGLGLTPRQIDALVDFLDNGLYDPAFARFDPNSSTDSFELNERDLIYSANRPELVAYGAVDGLMPSGLCPSSDDGLTRRDRGLEFLDVSRQIFVSVRGVERDAAHNMETHHLSLTNIGSSPIDTHLLMCFMNLSPGASVVGAEGFSEHLPSPGVPYMREFVPHGEVDPDSPLNSGVILSDSSVRIDETIVVGSSFARSAAMAKPL